MKLAAKLSFALLLVILLISVSGNLLFAQNLTVRVEPSQTTVGVNETFTVDVVVENVDNLGAFQFDITYNTGMVHANSAQMGDFLGSTGRTVIPAGPDIDNTSNPGKLTFGGATFGTTNGVDGSGVLATVEFLAQGEGNSNLDLQNVQISDTAGTAQSINSVVDGAVTVTPGSGVDDKHNPQTRLPERYALFQNYPNPFNPETLIKYQLPEASYVSLRVFDILGNEVRTLVKSQKESGEYQVIWDGRDNRGNQVASGIYFYQLQADDFVSVRKMLHLE